MGELFAGWRFVGRRLVSGWRLMSVMAVGVVLAATLLAAAPIYATSLSELGLQFRLERQLGDDRLISVRVDRLYLGDAADRSLRDAVDTIFEARVGWLGPERLVAERSARMKLTFAADEEAAATAAEGASSEGAAAEGEESAAAEEAPPRRWDANLFWLSGYEQHVTVIEGRLPGPAAGPAEVVLLDGFQRHASLGETVRLQALVFDDCQRIPPSDDPAVARAEKRCRPTTFVSRTITATIVGFVRPNDPADDFWTMFRGSLEAPEAPPLASAPLMRPDDEPTPEQSAAERGEGSMPLLTSAEQFFGPFAAAMPYATASHTVGLLPEIAAITLGDVERGIQAADQLRDDMWQRLGLELVFSDLPIRNALSRFRNTQTFEQIPLMIILLQVVGIVLYYVAVVAAMLVERQAEELAVFRSRGASTAQLVGLYLMEGTLIAIAAAAAAPWLAGRAVAALGFTPTFRALTDGHALPVAIAPAAFLLAAGGAALALIALLIPAFVSARRGIIDTKREQARPSGRSVIQRYYLDIGAVVLAGILLWQLNQRGSVFDPRSVGGWSSDPLLLASPFVFTVAVAAMVLRFYPWILRMVVAALLAATRGTAVALGLRRAARSPAAYARLMLLLLMSIAVGTFAASYGATVDRSQGDRVRYETGADFRGALLSIDDRAAGEKVAAVRELDGVENAALAFRGSFRAPGGGTVQMLALDPARAASMLWFRDDFAGESLRDLMQRLESAVPSGGGVTLDEDAVAVRLWLLSTGLRERSLLWARFRDAAGNYRSVSITKLDFTGAQEFDVLVPDDVPRPVTFAGLWITEGQGHAVGSRGALYIDDIRALLPGGEQVMLDDFENGLAWRQFGASTGKERFEHSDEQSRSGRFSAKWSWPLGMASPERFLLMNDPNVPVAAILNRSAAGLLRAGPGAVASLVLDDKVVPFSVRAVVDMFPTLNPDTPFMVVNLEHVRQVASALNLDYPRSPTELWVDTSGTLEQQQALVATLKAPDAALLLDRASRGSMLRAELLDEVQSDPTLRASGGGILTAAFAAVLGLSTLGFVVTLVLGARNRTVEFAVLLAVGSSRFQILRAMVLEWGVVLVIGTVIGVMLGRRVARVMLSFLDVTERGARVVPPFVLETDWLTLGLGVAALAVVAGAGLTLSWLSAVRRESTVELRMTQ